LFITDVDRWEEVGRAHGEFFADIRPASSMVQVSALIDPALLVEVEADAVVPQPDPAPARVPRDHPAPARVPRDHAGMGRAPGLLGGATV
jgi:hypothetical protein